MTSIAPWIQVADAGAAMDYYQAAFGAVALQRHEDGTGTVVVGHLTIDGADFWVQHDADAHPDPGGGTVRMILTVDDPDWVFAKAVAAGATVVAPMYEGHGWRIGRLADPSGHHWEIGKPLPT